MSKLISVTDEVYEMLKRRKNGDSFSKAIKELMGAGKDVDIMQFAGAFRDDKEFNTAMYEIIKKRENFRLKKVVL